MGKSLATLSLCVTALALSSCAGRYCGRIDSPDMYHEVDVPPRFSDGRGVAWVPSNHERYVESYEKGWWACIELYAKNIDYESTAADRIFNGWPASVEGYQRGFEDGEKRIRKNLKLHGKKKTHEHLVVIWEGL